MPKLKITRRKNCETIDGHFVRAVAGVDAIRARTSVAGMHNTGDELRKRLLSYGLLRG
jgi:hypothetical protein